MISFPQCKINIGLNIHYKRDDNYHEISSVMYPVPWCDILEIVPSNEFKFTHSGLSIPGKQEDNLCVRAYELLRRDFNIAPVHAHLRKNIPMGGGLGGGSADATEMLKLLTRNNELDLSDSELLEYTNQLGSDCAFFVKGTPQYAEGRGEVLTEIDLDLSGYHLLLINDGTHVSTKEAYANVEPEIPQTPLNELIKLPVEEWYGDIVNQFERSVFKTYPHLAELKDTLLKQGALYASMSGSGATLYGIFKSKPENIEQSFQQLTYSRWIEL